MKNSDLQTIENIKVGFLNGVFKSPALILTHLEQVFCGATLTIVNETENTLTIHCKSGQWEKETPYSRMIKFTYVVREDGSKKITDIEEVKD